MNEIKHLCTWNTLNLDFKLYKQSKINSKDKSEALFDQKVSKPSLRQQQCFSNTEPKLLKSRSSSLPVEWRKYDRVSDKASLLKNVKSHLFYNTTGPLWAPLRLDQLTLNSCTAGEEDTTHHFNSLTLKYAAACVIALISIPLHFSAGRGDVKRGALGSISNFN